MTAPRHESERVRKALVQRAGGRTLRRHTLYLSPALSRRLAVFCATRDEDLSDVVERAVLALLSGETLL